MQLVFVHKVPFTVLRSSENYSFTMSNFGTSQTL